jgi:hypothetical protein
VSADLVVCEEFAFMDVKMLHSVIIPLLLMDKTATVCITTLNPKPGNHVNHIVENKLMEVIDISLVCSDCRFAGESEKCRHMEWLRPWWQKTSRFDFVQKLLPPDIFAVEAQGLLREKDNACFKASWLKDLFLNRRFQFQPEETVDYLMYFIDPCSGSVKGAKKISEFGILAAVEPGCRIVAAEAIPTENPTSWEDLLIENIKKCYRVPAMHNAKLIVFIEGNMRTEAYTAKKCILRHFPDAEFPGSHDKDTVGVLTLPRSKHDMQQAFQMALVAKSVCIAKDIITSDKNPKGLVDKIREQLERFSYYTSEAKDPLGVTRYTYSGKGAHSDQMDDMAMTVLMACYYSQLFLCPTSKWTDMHKSL